jgi:hypothetical protein
VQTITGILNKITPDTYDKLSEQLCAIKLPNSTAVDKLIGILFETATQNRIFANIYADLCSKLKVKSKEWTFTTKYVVKDLDTDKYIWMSDLDLNEISTAGPYELPDDCISAVISTENYPEMQTFSVIENKLEFQDTLITVKAGVLIKIYKHPDQKYYASYKPIADINPNFISSESYTDITKAQKATSQANFRKILIKESQIRFYNIVDGTGIYYLYIYLYL